MFAHDLLILSCIHSIIMKGSGEKRQLNVFRILRENEAGSSDCHRADAILCVCDKALIGEHY